MTKTAHPASLEPYLHHKARCQMIAARYYGLRLNQVVALPIVQEWLKRDRKLKPIARRVHAVQLEAEDWEALAAWSQRKSITAAIRQEIPQD